MATEENKNTCNMAMTPQYIALRKLLHTICSTLSKTPDSISPLANDLNGEGLIPDAVSSAVQQTAGIAPYNLASKLVSAVHIAIKLNTDKFYVFAQKLDEHEFPELSKKLLEKCGKHLCSDHGIIGMGRV